MFFFQDSQHNLIICSLSSPIQIILLNVIKDQSLLTPSTSTDIHLAPRSLGVQALKSSCSFLRPTTSQEHEEAKEANEVPTKIESFIILYRNTLHSKLRHGSSQYIQYPLRPLCQQQLGFPLFVRAWDSLTKNEFKNPSSYLA